jgi:hypothetical protein
LLATSSSAAFAQASSTQASSYSPPQSEHKKKPKKPKKPHTPAKPAGAESGQSQ